MRTFKSGCLALVLSCLSLPAFAQSEENHEWRYSVDFFTMTDLVGYTPVYVVSDDGKMPYDGRKVPQLLTRFGADVTMEWSWAWVELRPYVHSEAKSDGLRMSLGGIEGWLGVPVYDRFALGFYHNSAHNFSLGDYGYGTNLNSFFLRTVHSEGAHRPFGDKPLKLRLTTEAHVFVSRDGSSNLFAESAKTMPADIGRISWRFLTVLDLRHPLGRSRPTVTVNGDERWRMASVMAHLPIAARLGPGFIDPLGEHLYLGPYFDFGWNLYRTEQFGSVLWAAGIQLDVAVVDTRRD
jgi:hypothetical protein